MKSPAPFVMSWNIQYLGSYAVGKVKSDSLQRRMDKVAHSDIIPQFVYLSISLNGVFVATEDKPKNPFIAHSIRKICCVVGNTDSRQVAYVIKRSAENGKSKKECHIFRTEISQQVEDVKAVLSSAFQRIVFVDNSTTTPLPSFSSVTTSSSASETTISSHRSASLPRITPQQHQRACKTELQSPSVTSTLPYTPSTPLSTRNSNHHRQMSAAVLFQRFFGGTPKTSTPDCPSPSPLRKNKDSERGRRKRPVSEVFGQAIRSAANTLTPKRTVSKPLPPPSSSGGLCGTPAVMLRDKLARIQESENEGGSPQKKEPELEFDEKLGEFVFPIYGFMDDQLQRLAYFCNNPNKFEVLAVLSQMPEGAFLLRYSESRGRCLALSVRVPTTTNGENNIAHYLIIRNEQGFRLRGSQRFFTSLPMLITHHTVLPETLPCRLIFVEWDKMLLKGRSTYGTPIPLGYPSRENEYTSTPRMRAGNQFSQSPHKKHARRSFEFYQY